MMGRWARPTPPVRPDSRRRRATKASRSYLKKRFATWGAEQRVELGTDAGEAPIHYKYHYVDGHLTRWSCADLDQVYLELHPAKVIVEADELEAVLDEAKGLPRLSRRRRVCSTRKVTIPACSRDHIDAIASRFRNETWPMSSRFSPGKHLWKCCDLRGCPASTTRRRWQSFMGELSTRAHVPSVSSSSAMHYQLPRPGRRRVGPRRQGTRPRQISASRRRKRH